MRWTVVAGGAAALLLSRRLLTTSSHVGPPAAPWALQAYERATTHLLPSLYSALFLQRLRRQLREHGLGDADAAEAEAQKWGRGSSAGTDGSRRTVWLHAVSVGEALSTLPLLSRLEGEYPEAFFLLTVGTAGAYALMRRRDGPRFRCQMAPLDHPPSIDRFLDRWRPTVGLFFESELWPNLVRRAADLRGVPLALVNARMSRRSEGRWARAAPARGVARYLLARCFRLVLCQSDADRARFSALGAPSPAFLGNLKSASRRTDPNSLECTALREAIGGRPAWLAASTHEGEEEAALGAHAALASTYPGLLTILAPRHPERGAAAAALAATRGLRSARRSLGEPLLPGTAVYIVDTLGELPAFYACVPACFVGGSLYPGIGGHNFLEPAAASCAVLQGPHTENFAGVASDLAGIEPDALWTVASEGELQTALASLLSDPAEAQRRGRAAGRAAAALGEGVVERVAAALRPVLRGALEF
eukprot:tig00020603_g11837.t1